MTILHVLDDLGTGGSERQLTAFLVRSDPRRFRHEVCALTETGPCASELDAAGIRVHSLGLAPNGRLVQAVSLLWNLVGAVKPDILHATLFRPSVVSRIIGKLSGKPVITTLVNTTYEPQWRLDNPRLTGAKAWVAQTLDRLTARWGTGFVAVTQSVKLSAVRQLGIREDRITVIPRGLIPAPDRVTENGRLARLKQTLRLDGAYPIILNVGRLVPQKGQRHAIRAMSQVVARFPTARLLIAGEGWLRRELERLIRSERLEAHVTLLGERRDVGELLRVADLFVFPSLYEGAANALLEAMAAGKVCVVSRIPSLEEITGDGAVAFLADLRSSASLAANVIRLAEDRVLAERMGREARVWVRARYSIDTTVAALEALYEQVLARHPVRAEQAV